MDAIEVVSAIWNNLRERFSHSDLLRVGELQQDLYSLKQGTLSVSDFFTELTTIWEELENYRPTFHCICIVRCSCVSSRNVVVYKKED